MINITQVIGRINLESLFFVHLRISVFSNKRMTLLINQLFYQ
jgi:hypothetical protein